MQSKWSCTLIHISHVILINRLVMALTCQSCDTEKWKSYNSGIYYMSSQVTVR